MANPLNPRKIRTSAPGFRDFTKTVKAAGVLVPLHVRPHPTEKGKYEILAGERRWRAAKQAHQATVPAIVHVGISEEDALRLSVIENLEREDLTPLEEGQAVATLLDRFDGDAETVAEQIGRSEKWVRVRGQLRHLCPGWVKAVRQTESTPALFGVAHLSLVARFPRHIQEAALESLTEHYRRSRWTLQDLDEWLNREFVRRLVGAAWKLDDADLVAKAPACTACTKRSSVYGVLFHDPKQKAEDVKKDDRCLDVSCWNWKARTYLDQSVAAVREKHPEAVAITTDYLSYRGEAALQERFGDILGPNDSTPAKSQATKGAVVAVVVEGPGLGKRRWIVPRPKGGGAQRKAGPTPLRDRRVVLNAKRLSWILAELQGTLSEKSFAEIQDVGQEAPCYPDATGAGLLIAMVAVLGTGPRVYRAGNEWKAVEELIAADEEKRHEALWERLRPVLHQSLTYVGPKRDMPLYYARRAEAVANLLGLDYAEIQARAEVNFPEPKTWAKLNPDGTPKRAGKDAA